jgi:glycosyltransferase involved in cell wall biosynthesis
VRIWLVTVGEPLPLPGNNSRLIRTGQLAQYLGTQGHDVVWWSSTFDHLRKTHHFNEPREIRIQERVLLKLLHAPRYPSNVSLTRLRHQLVAATAFRREARFMDVPDVILCSYPTIELSWEAVRYGRKMGSRVALDVRDLWPDIFLEGLPRFLRPLGAPVIGVYDRIGRAALRAADGIVAISDGYLDWALKKAGRSRSENDAVLPIGFSRPEISQPDLDRARSQLAEHGVQFEKTLAIFVGTFGRTYDLSTVLRAARMLEQQLPQLQFVLAGDGENAATWRQESHGLTNVVMPGWLGDNELVALCSAGSIGLQSYSRGAPQGLANKLFEYLGYGLALVSSLEGENAELIVRNACGVNYRPGDAEALCERLSGLVRRRERLEDAMCNARALFKREFSLPAIHQRFATYLTELSRESTRAPGLHQGMPGRASTSP